MELYILATLAVCLLILSFIKDRGKTKKALKMALKRMGKMASPILLLIGLMSLILYLVPEETVSKYLSSGTYWTASTAGALLGSVLMMPGFIAFPLSGILQQNGVPWMVIASFTTTLMMVGLVTLPVESKFLGWKVALLRNSVSFFIALAVALAAGIAYGEIAL